MTYRIGVLVAVLAAMGCSKKSESSDGPPAAKGKTKGSSADKAKQTAEQVPDGDPLPVPSWKPDATPGAAYFAVEGRGIVGLEDGKFFDVVANKHLAKDLRIGADGAVYASLIGGGIYRIQGKKAEKLTTKYYDEVASSKEGEVWAADMREVHHYDGKAWESISRKDWGDKGLVADMGFDGAGNLFLAGSYNLRIKAAGGEWKQAETQALTGDKPFFKTVSAAPDGSVYVSFGRGALRYADGKWQKISLGTKFFTGELALLPSGWLAGASSGKLAMFGPGGKSIEADKEMLGFDPKRIAAVSGDGRGRVWLSTDVGIAIVDDGAKLIQHWKPGSVAGMTGRVSHMVILKGGPELPEVGPVRKGTVVGKAVWDDGKPLVGKTVQMCERPKMMFRKSPCEDAAFKMESKTAPDGAFRFEAVPIGPYGFAIRGTDKWSKTSGSRTCCAALKDGETFDVGPLAVRRKPLGK